MTPYPPKNSNSQPPVAVRASVARAPSHARTTRETTADARDDTHGCARAPRARVRGDDDDDDDDVAGVARR